MAKKKKSKRADARGYSISNGIASVKAKTKSADTTTTSRTKVAVTAAAHEGLTSLLTDLKKGGERRSSASLPSSSNIAVGNKQRYTSRSYVTDRGEHTPQEYPIDPNDKRFIKKVENIHAMLIDLSFTEGQIKSALEALGGANGSDFDLDLTLDWLCLNLPSEDLPSLFVEQDVQIRALEEGGISVHVVKGDGKDNTGGTSGANRESANELIDMMAAASLSKKQSDSDNASNDKEDKARRALLLAQYQYEEESDVEDGAHNQSAASDENADIKEAEEEQQQQQQQQQVATAEEKRLAELERQIKEEGNALNDDGALYMMSKYEVADLKRRVKKLQGQAKGLRGKVAKIRAERERKKREGNYEQEEEEDEGAAAFSLFGGGEDIEEETATYVQPKQPPAIQNLGRQYSTVSTTAPSIPKDWTGATPKKVLEDYCMKQKLPRPQFSKLAQSNNGCKIVVHKKPLVQKKKKKISQTTTAASEEEVLMIENPGPFFNFSDAQHYLSTEAMYELSPSLPLYRLLPPIFRSIWTAWQDEEKAEEVAEVAKEQSEKRANIEELVKSIYASYKASGVGAQIRSDAGENYTKEAAPESGEEVLPDWDKQSSEEEESPGIEAIKVSTDKIAVHLHHDTKLSLLGKKLRKEFELRTASPAYKEMLKERAALPIYSYRQSILDTVRANTVTVLCASTGAGKSTNCPLFLLEEALASGLGDKANIICTQPRRVAAISVAERVADEICESIGGTVGYHIRMESRKSSKTKLTFCTTGVILRRLQDDPNLNGVSHVAVDECHERQWQIDFLLIALRRLINTTRKDLKVILMSATIDSKVFCTFFQGAPFLTVPGRTFPVAEYFLEDVLDATNHIIEEGSRCAIRSRQGKSDTTELWVTGRGGEKHRKVVSLEDEIHSEVSDEFSDYSMSTRKSMDRVDETVLNYDLIEDILSLLVLNPQQNDSIVLPDGADNSSLTKGSVLIFLPGMGEIRLLTERLKGSRQFGDRNRFSIIPMHSSLSPADQRRAFVKPKRGCQKIILATNICETSITIPDVVCVIDSGLMREVRRDKRSGTSTLVTDWCSRANAKQRAGRAGRVQPGLCCKLFSSRTLHKKMHEQPIPELQRVPLEEACLSILAGKLGQNCMEFLLQSPQPPSEESVQAALVLLEEVGAIETSASGLTMINERLTPLGIHLAKLPVHVRLGKMLIFGALFKCLDETLTIAASLSTKSPFVANVSNASEAAAAQSSFAHPSSDFLTICNVWRCYQSASSESYSKGRKFCDRNYLSHTALLEISDMRDQFLQLLHQIGFVSASFRKGGKMEGDLSKYNQNSKVNGVVDAVILAGLYPNIAHAEKTSRTDPPALWCKNERVFFHSSSINHKVVNLATDWVAFYEKFATTRTYIAATSLVKPFSLMLFGKSIVVRHLERKVVVDDSVELNVAAQTGVAFRELRWEIEVLLKQMIEKAGRSAGNNNQERMIDGIVGILANEH